VTAPNPSPSPGDAIAAAFMARAAAMRAEADRLRAAVHRLGALRLAAFATIVVLVAGAIAYANWRTLWLALAAGGMVAFLRLLAISERLAAERVRAATIAAVNEQAAARVVRDWERVPLRPITRAPVADDPVADDLDLFGPRSLAHLLPPLSSAHGAPLMHAWLTNAATPELVAARQAAVRELRPDDSVMEELALHATRSRVTEEASRRFAEWGAQHTAPPVAWMRVASVLVPAAFVALIGMQFARVVDRPYWLLAALANLFVAGRAHRLTQPMLAAAESVADVAGDYVRTFAALSTRDWRAERLARLHDVLFAGGEMNALNAFRRLARLAAWAAVRASPMLHAILQATLLWDCHVARALFEWRAVVGPAVATWFAALAEVECLAAFAGLAVENPDFTFPQVAPIDPTRLSAKSLGHPLLAARTRVANDVTIGPPGTTQLISGSNMAGKSTLLRAIGLNAVLALAGAPVCAEEMTCPVVRLRTSIQVRDSLERGLSYFMAEVARLREIVTTAEDASDDESGPVLYVIDEMLSGTNSEERAVAIRLIVERLLATSAIGVITTHDLPAFCVDPIQRRLIHTHFRERVTGEPGHETMDFDYRLYDGPATSRNALRLLAAAGLVPAR
jgi:hypothetical protein